MAQRIEELIVNLDGKIFPKFADLTRDENPLHRDIEFAKNQNFTDTPAQGVLLFSYFEELALRNNLNPKSYSLKFKAPAYPRDKLTFAGKIKEDIIKFECKNQDSNLIATCDIGKKSSFDFTKRNFLEDFYELSKKNITSFYSFLGIEERKKMPVSLVMSLIPSFLLKISSDKTGKPEGIFKAINIQIFNEPVPGIYNTKIYKLGEPKQRKNLFIYNLKGICSQEGKQILSGDINVFSKQKLDF